MYFLYREAPLGDGSNEHRLHAVFSQCDWDNDLPEAQRLLFHYQPDPSYIDWVVQNMDHWFIPPADLEVLQELSVQRLVKIESPKDENGWVLTPHFEHSKHRFQYVTFRRAQEKEIEWRDSEQGSRLREDEEDIGSDELYDLSDLASYCPACEQSMPCGCSYANDQL